MDIFKKGQGATEYLVLLAVVLIIALVSIALLGFFPGLAADARITQSQSYWRGEARPFAILDNSFNSTGAGSLVIQNNDASGTFTITAVAVANGSCSSGCSSLSFAPGETKTVAITGATTGSAGGVYDMNVTITYTTPNGVMSKQYGAKNIIGKFVS